jgi:beta-glucosidase/6-phospho-beta-glucosidase/beta-galactosidase
VLIGLGYETGSHAPGNQLSGAPLLTCWHNAMLAHGWMVQAVRAADPNAQVGLASCGLVCTPEHESAAASKPHLGHVFVWQTPEFLTVFAQRFSRPRDS